MKNRLKSIIALVFTVIVSINVFAFKVDGVDYYTTSDSTVSVTYTWNNGNYNSYSGNVIIPSSVTYNGKTYSVTEIGEDAFYLCTGLTNVTIPNSIIKIGQHAFRGCTNLTNITIPNNVKTIGNWAFFNCTSLTTLNYNADNCSGDGFSSSSFYSYHWLCNCDNLETVNIGNNVTVIPNYFITGRSKVASITIPDGVTTIGNCAFYGCTNLTSIHLPEGLKEIGASAFENCINLEEINIPSSVESIHWNFSNCTNLPVIDGIRYADTYLIEVVDTLSSYTIKDGTRWIGGEAFKDCGFITNIELPEGLTEIHYEAFYGCIGLTNIVLPNSVKILEGDVFAECTGLTEITIGTDLISINGDQGTFKNCTNLKTINFNAIRCQKDGKGWNNAFVGCNNVETINIGDSVKTIWHYLFGGDNGFKVKNIYMGANVDTIGSSAFYNCYFDTMFMQTEHPPVLMNDKSLGTHNSLKRNIVVPCGSTENYENAQYWKNYNIIENCSSLTDISNNTSISVYPNPAKETVTFDLGDLTVDDTDAITIINSTGQVVYKSDIKSQKSTIDVSHLESGVYYIKVGNITKKLIVK